MISRSIPIRWEDEAIADIDRIAHKIGLRRSGFVKMAVSLYCHAVADGRISLVADDFTALMNDVSDGTFRMRGAERARSRRRR